MVFELAGIVVAPPDNHSQNPRLFFGTCGQVRLTETFIDNLNTDNCYACENQKARS